MEVAEHVLAVDIGGTKTHLGLYVRGKKRPRLKIIRTFVSRDVPDVETALERFLESVSVPVSGVCIGVAGPVMNGRAHGTNLPWYISENRIRKRFGWRRVRLINDLTATAVAVPLLSQGETLPLNKTKVRKKGNRVLVAPGTGLGTALIVCENGRYIPVASEGGHADFSPNTETESELWRYLHRRFGHVSVERVLTGSGLYNIYQWLAAFRRYRTPEWLRQRLKQMDPARAITECALDDRDPLCVDSLNMFVSIFGAVAGNLALTGMATGGVYLGGGIPPKILPVLKKRIFMDAFVNKGRLKSVMQGIGVRVILNDKAALLGAAHVAHELADKKGD